MCRGLEDSFAELAQQVLRQIALPQLVQDVHPLLHRLYDGDYSGLPLQVWQMVILRKLQDSMTVTVLRMVKGDHGGGFFLKSTILRVFSSRLLRLHQCKVISSLSS